MGDKPPLLPSIPRANTISLTLIWGGSSVFIFIGKGKAFSFFVLAT